MNWKINKNDLKERHKNRMKRKERIHKNEGKKREGKKGGKKREKGIRTQARKEEMIKKSKEAWRKKKESNTEGTKEKE